MIRQRKAHARSDIDAAGAKYPNRGKHHHAHNLTRALFASGACQQIGHQAVNLVVFVAHEEDRWRYSRAPRFWNTQLMEFLGYKSRTNLIRIRQSAIDAGWLHYERKDDHSDAAYWTKIPTGVVVATPICSEIETDTRNQMADCSEIGTHSRTDSGTQSGTPPTQETKKPKKPKNTRAAVAASHSRTRNVFRPEGIEMPSELADLEFRKSWSSWCQHRREKRSPLTQTCAMSQLKRFAEWGAERSIRAIEHTIEKGWIGIREPDNESRPSHREARISDTVFAALPAIPRASLNGAH